MDLMTRFDKELDALRDRVTEEVIYEVIGKLKDLGRRYPRHSFGLIDGMGISVLKVDPPFLGTDMLSYYDFNWTQHPNSIMEEFFTAFDEIFTYLDWLDDTFNISIGDIPLQVKD